MEQITFRGDGERHSATFAVNRYIRAQGWSIGSSDITGRRGVLFARDVLIAKWKNLTLDERAECDAVVVGRGPFGDRVFMDNAAAPVCSDGTACQDMSCPGTHDHGPYRPMSTATDDKPSQPQAPQ